MSDEHRFDDDGGNHWMHTNIGTGGINKSSLSTMIQFVVSSADLTEAQARHVESIGKTFALHMASKYTKGQKEHGGNLWDQTTVQLVESAIAEAIDQVVYLLTLREKIRGIR